MLNEPAPLWVHKIAPFAALAPLTVAVPVWHIVWLPPALAVGLAIVILTLPAPPAPPIWSVPSVRNAPPPPPPGATPAFPSFSFVVLCAPPKPSGLVVFAPLPPAPPIVVVPFAPFEPGDFVISVPLVIVLALDPVPPLTVALLGAEPPAPPSAYIVLVDPNQEGFPCAPAAAVPGLTAPTVTV
ncbi:hypothetical protein FLAT13_00026 [Flavobacterium salmonis]|uniref:Uncharacterized protein n=1 Tax=Flavobacterium salmonis TaxID=2654844 RepID=A0A6V6YLX3_9FLAO|nr:hypothetical protein FLAT13_00026 [Flavobacterium salmonis]